MWAYRNIRDKIHQYASGEDAQLTARYRDLYGDGSYVEELDAHRKQRHRRIAALVSVFLLVFICTAYKEYTGTAGLIYEDGKLVAVERPEEGAGAVTVDTRIYAVTERGTVSEERALIIGAFSEETSTDMAFAAESFEEQIRRRIDTAARQLDSDRSDAVVYLPQTLEDGTRLVWTDNRKSVLPLLPLLFGAMLFYLYRSRFAGIAQKEKEAQESVICELPEFLHKLVLLLGAGVVLESAFRRAMEGVEGDSYFAGQIRYIKRRAEETNASLYEEFNAFAARSGVRELSRVAGIISDNLERGTDLSVKLREESELLWFERKKQAEEKGRLAETKLTMPLAILLCVLVLVTVSPALFEM